MRIRTVIIIACVFMALPMAGKVKLYNKTITPQTEYACEQHWRGRGFHHPT